MKKFAAFLALVALLTLPASVMAAKSGDFELGGYIKLLAYWESTNSVNKNISWVNTRNNARYPAHDGHTRFTAQETRFNFKIKGPEVWGAKTQGYIELDFDPNQDGRQSASQSYTPRLRHAWFRMDWPGGWQVLMGQYWGVFCNFYPETVNSGPMQFHGQATQRIPQIRVSYSTGPWKFAALMGVAYDPGAGAENAAAAFGTLPGTFPGGTYGNALGQRGIMPQFGAQIEFEKDFYGKAAFYGRPRGFVANVSAGVQRTKYDGGVIAGAFTWGQNNFQGGGFGFINNETLTPWAVQATLFIPILPTQTKDLKGTASVTAQFYVSHGPNFWGNGLDSDNSYFVFDHFSGTFEGANILGANGVLAMPIYKRRLQQRYGGYIQGQYYINNEWFVSYVYGFSKAYGVTQSQNGAVANWFGGVNPNGYEYLSQDDQTRDIQEHNVSLFYRPIKNFKFGLGYSYIKTNWFQITTVGSRETRLGDNHRVQFCGVFYF